MNRLYLQPKFTDRLKKLTVLPNELNGVLLYQEIDGKDIVLCSQILGYGTDSSTTTNKYQIATINEFLRLNQRYGFVEFHTHTEQTVARYGEYYGCNLSSGDIKTIIGNYAGDEKYRHLLVTPSVFKLHAIERTNVVPIGYFLLQKDVDDGDLGNQINDAINAIQRRKGIAPLEIRI